MLISLLRMATNPTAGLTSLHKKYGSFVKVNLFNKKLIYTSSPDDFSEIFTQEAKGLLNRDSLYNAKKAMFGDGLFNSNGDIWTNQRRLMQPFFSKDGVEAWKSIMLEEAIAANLRICNSLDKCQVNISLEAKETLQRIMVRVLFGQSISGKADKQLMDSIDTIVKGLFPHLLAETFGKGKLKHLLFFQNRRMQNAINQFAAFVDNEIERSKADHSGTGLVSMLINATLISNSYKISNQLLRDEAVTMFLAGQDTTVNTLAWFFYLIGKHEAIHRKITAEIQSHVGDKVTLDNIENLTYTKAALYETLRLYPQAIAISRDVAETMELNGKTVDKGTTIILSIYATHRDPSFWQYPDKFYPEHFLDEHNNSRHKYAYLPYGGGMHTCVGRHFAEIEMMIIIATILKNHSVRTKLNVKPTVSITYKPERDILISITENTLI